MESPPTARCLESDLRVGEGPGTDDAVLLLVGRTTATLGSHFIPVLCSNLKVRNRSFSSKPNADSRRAATVTQSRSRDNSSVGERTLTRESVPNLVEGTVRATPERLLTKVCLRDRLEGGESVVVDERGSDVGSDEPLVGRERLELLRIEISTSCRGTTLDVRSRRYGSCKRQPPLEACTRVRSRTSRGSRCKFRALKKSSSARS